MIPKIIHYCWMGGAPLPELAERCMASWKEHMPNWEYMRWDESNFEIAAAPVYVKQAYEAKKFAFVSDYVRLWALEKFGGLYMDIDFLVHRPFDDLMDKYAAFAGVEGCKRQAVMMGVIASEAHGAWVTDMLRTYATRAFIREDGSLDLTPNTTYFSDRLESQGYIPDGKEKDVFVDGEFFLHVLPVWAFCPRLTTGEDVRNENTYCEHMGLDSWNTHTNWQTKLVKYLSPKWKIRIIKLKRKLFG
ncbi:MAG: glycosyl transferase [Paludibacteraceae bacterium]|nr:glycosyl transferase [Paludibacteraceae bacterium]